MSSSTSPFRPWLLALAGLVAIEGAYYAVARPPRATWNSFLDLQFAQVETIQRLFAYEKIVAFEKVDADIIQVGDSSGLHGVQPPIVMSHIPGYNYLNLSVATNLGYSGYYNIAKVQLKRSPRARYLVLYTSPVGGVPRKMLWDEDQKLMAPLIYNEFLSPLHHFVQLPTLAARQRVTDYVYSMKYRFKPKGAPLAMNRGYLAFMSAFRDSNGWTRETDVEGDVPTNIYKAILPGITVNQSADPDAIRAALLPIPRVTDEKFFDWRTLSHVSYFDHVYDAFAELARNHGVQLVLVFNPFPETSRRPEFDGLMDWKAIEAGLKRVRERNPEVIVTGFDFWPDEKFSVFSHVGTPSSGESSHRVGRIMKEIIGNRPAAERAQTAKPALPRMPVKIDFSQPYCGYGWTDRAAATNGFPLEYIGPRNKAWICTAFAPGSAYTVRGIFRADDPELADRIELKANDRRATKLSSGRSGENLYAEWLVPMDSVDAYRGWMMLEVDLGGPPRDAAEGKQTVSFVRIVATPENPR